MTEHSLGWSKLSDRELAEWHAEKVDNNFYEVFERITTEGTSELRDRGIGIQPSCASCGKRRMVWAHDYICILCRHAS